MIDQYETFHFGVEKRRTAQSGTWDKSGTCAETTASEVAKAAMVEKRMLTGL